MTENWKNGYLLSGFNSNLIVGGKGLQEINNSEKQPGMLTLSENMKSSG